LFGAIILSIHVVIPAGGSGSRFGATLPKQYLSLAGKSVIEWTLSPFLMLDEIDCIWVAVTSDIPESAQTLFDRLAQDYPKKFKVIACAGETRAQTVLAACQHVQHHVKDHDPWVLVHDAARPGITKNLIRRLLEALNDEPVGALLAVPVADTLKREESVAPNSIHAPRYVHATLPRSGLWQAQTPQAFRVGMLIDALSKAGALPSDESSAIEAIGGKPKLVLGDPTNFKLTHPADGVLLSALLAVREKECE